MTLPERKINMEFTAAVITVSDKGSKGERVDTSGPALCKMLEDDGSIVPLKAGDVSYCPKDCQHSLRNNSDADLVVFAVIPTH